MIVEPHPYRDRADMLHHPPLRWLLASCLLAGGLASAQQDGTKPKLPLRTGLVEAIQRFEPVRKRVAANLTRVSFSYAVVNRVPGSGREIVTPMPLGTFLGIIVDPLPVIAIPTAILEPANPAVRNLSTIPTDDGKSPTGMRGPFFDAILGSGQTVRLVVRDSSRPLGLTFLGLEDPAAPPAELRIALELPTAPRAAAPLEEFAIPLFRDPLNSSTVTTVPGRLPLGSESFVRPALTGVPGATLGCPLFSYEGEWLGLVNGPPPGEKWETVRIEKPDVAALSAGRDPAEYTHGYRWPLLYSILEVAPEIARVRAAACAPRAFPELGLTLVDRGGGVEVVAIDARTDAPVTIEPHLAAHDRIVGIGDATVATVLGFERELERALASDAAEIAVRVERSAEALVATLRFRG